MGGNALKHCEIRRIAAAAYFPIEAAVVARLRADFPGRRVEAIKAYRSKASFGDLDIVFECADLALDLAPYLLATFASREIVRNGAVYSFEHQAFQIDLILTPPAEVQTSLDYFSYNDLGNLLGRVAHSMGLKLGHAGLLYVMRRGTEQFAEITVARDWATILPLLGYRYATWAAGFDTLDEIFRFVVSSPYFNRAIFQLENRNHASRVRDLKRKTYMDFLAWIADAPAGSLPDFPARSHQAWLPQLCAAVPGLAQEVAAARARLEAGDRVRQRFNGALVAALTGLSARELGAFMQTVREHFGGKAAQDAWVEAASDAQIAATIVDLFKMQPAASTPQDGGRPGE